MTRPGTILTTDATDGLDARPRSLVLSVLSCHPWPRIAAPPFACGSAAIQPILLPCNAALRGGFSWHSLAPMIARKTDVQAVRTALKRSRVVGLLGPRQCGKTTLAREIVAPDSLNYFDLESPASLARLSEPETALRPLKGLIVIDEIQHRPELFPRHALHQKLRRLLPRPFRRGEGWGEGLLGVAYPAVLSV